MKFSFSISTKDTTSHARTGTIHTPHGAIQTPAFSPVATRASVRALSARDVKEAGSQVVLANTYHLYLQPGVDVIEQFGGFGPFMNWHGPTITDSGGYQVSFLWEPNSEQNSRAHSVKITDEGATFRSHIDGSTHVLTPETSMDIQRVLGADIIMAFDQPLSDNYSDAKNKDAFERSMAWERRSFGRWRENEERKTQDAASANPPQALFGIVHGGTNREFVSRSFEMIAELDFPGIAIGGDFIGSDPTLTAAALDMANEFRDFGKPVHALGLGGGPEGIFAAVERGIDLFDNTSVTRMARAGLLFIYPEDGGNVSNKFRLDISRSAYKTDDNPISSVCDCSTCQKYTRAYLNHLLKAKEFLGFTLASIHNVHYINNLMHMIREAIDASNFQNFKKEWIAL